MRQRELDLILIRFNQLEQKLDRLLEISEKAGNNLISINPDSDERGNTPEDRQKLADVIRLCVRRGKR